MHVTFSLSLLTECINDNVLTLTFLYPIVKLKIPGATLNFNFLMQ